MISSCNQYLQRRARTAPRKGGRRLEAITMSIDAIDIIIENIDDNINFDILATFSSSLWPDAEADPNF
jgi:hypothetical protein